MSSFSIVSLLLSALLLVYKGVLQVAIATEKQELHSY